jgi:hypothetical protein
MKKAHDDVLEAEGNSKGINHLKKTFKFENGRPILERHPCVGILACRTQCDCSHVYKSEQYNATKQNRIGYRGTGSSTIVTCRDDYRKEFLGDAYYRSENVVTC